MVWKASSPKGKQSDCVHLDSQFWELLKVIYIDKWVEVDESEDSDRETPRRHLRVHALGGYSLVDKNPVELHEVSLYKEKS